MNPNRGVIQWTLYLFEHPSWIGTRSATSRQPFESTHIAPKNAADAFYIVVSGDDLLIKDDDGDITPISADDWRWCGLDAISEHCLGVVNQVPIYAVEVADDVDEPNGFGFESLWWFLSKVDSDLFYLLGRAKQIIEWQRTHRFCGKCGGRRN